MKQTAVSACKLQKKKENNMHNRKLAVLSSLFAVSGFFHPVAWAAGFVTLPTSGSSAYVACRSGAGAGPDNTLPPLADSACVVPNGVGTALNFNATPEPGFILLTTNVSSITAFSETLGTLNERVFVNSPSPITQCIYAKQVVMSNTGAHDYNPYKAGTNRMIVNDIAFGGYTGAVSAGYAKANASTNKSVYRIGRTFTSVQLKRQLDLEDAPPCAGWALLPPIGGMPGTEINGVGLISGCSVTPSTAQQEAPLSNSWVDFTTYVSAGLSPDLTANPASPQMYIKQACTNSTTSQVANSFKLRQTGAGYSPWVVVTGTSRAPSTDITP